MIRIVPHYFLSPKKDIRKVTWYAPTMTRLNLLEHCSLPPLCLQERVWKVWFKKRKKAIAIAGLSLAVVFEGFDRVFASGLDGRIDAEDDADNDGYYAC